MLRWSDLDGRAAARLRGALAGARLPHAYLFTGPRLGPQLRATRLLASAVNCQGNGDDPAADPCGTCDACHKIDTGIHPDVVTLEREGAAQLIPIETVRSQVIARLGLPPHEARVRVFIIEEAAALAGPSANAMLKTLEEPPRRTLFLLCTVAPDGLLPTIRSRCQRVRFAAGPGLDEEAPEGDASAVARREHLAALALELAQAGRPPVELPARICEGKGDAPLVVAEALRALHRRATDAAGAGELGAAREACARATGLLDIHRAMTVHNAQPQLALEALLAGWRNR